ncbi:alpha/beta hydrolase family protein [Streptacidiphilus sp. N1-12]|uniref:Alpha/beta hydrolase family protein n=2 Tax=Streptacidiphilus alkalitolerans TaxID=3342712 RepID=A0ABV6WRJ6_9ACTN
MLRRLALFAVAVVLTGCSSAAPKAEPAFSPYDCLSVAQWKTLVQLSSDGSQFDAHVSGKGTVGIVYAHMSGADLCEWSSFAKEAAGEGYLTLTYTSSGSMDLDVTAAVGELKRRGATRVVLVGGSMGGTAVLTAASLPEPLPVAAVVSLSAPESYGGDNALNAVKQLRMPVQFMVDQGDSDFADGVAELSRVCGSAHKVLKVYPGSGHASAVLADSKAKADFDAFIRTYAPPS